MTRARFTLLLAGTLAILNAVALHAAEPTADEIRRSVSIEQRLGKPLPLDVMLRDERGKMVELRSAFGSKPVIITPVYYSCPMLCNITIDSLINRMSDMRLDVGRDFNVVTFSFDPSETTPEGDAKRTLYLRRYGRIGAGEGWHFFTADQASIKRLTDALGFHFVWDAKKKQFAHPAAVIVATPEGRIAQYFYGMDYQSRDLRLGLVEASGNKIGTATDKLMLLCYDYDPGTGKYAATAMNIVRLGGAASVFGLAGFIFVMLRKERLGLHK